MKYNRCIISGITSIKMANKSDKLYHVNEQTPPTLELEVQELNTTEYDDVYR